MVLFVWLDLRVGRLLCVMFIVGLFFNSVVMCFMIVVFCFVYIVIVFLLVLVVVYCWWFVRVV